MEKSDFEINLENEGSLYSKCYRMFDVDFILSSDSRKAVDDFEFSYRKFLRKNLKSPNSFKVIINKKNTKRPCLIFNSEKKYLPQSENISPYVTSFVISRLLDMVNKYFVIHGGAVEKNGQGLLICGETSFGKTTLVLKLMERDFNLLSDEFAPIDRENRMIASFHQSIAIEDFALENIWKRRFIHDAVHYRHKFNPNPKQIIDLEDVADKRKLSDRSFLKYIVFLISDVEEGNNNIINVIFLNNSEKLIPEFGSIRGVTILEERKIDNYFLAVYSVVKEKMAVREFYECYEKHRDDIIFMEKKIINRPDFSTPVKLSYLSRAKAATQLLVHLRNFSPQSLLFKEFNGKYSNLLFSIATLLEDVECFTLKPGNLEKTADILSSKFG